jgi:hypothetical protein
MSYYLNEPDAFFENLAEKSNSINEKIVDNGKSLTTYKFTGDIVWTAVDKASGGSTVSIITITSNVQKTGGKSAKKECPTKTSRTYKGKDGVVRRLYQRAGDFFVRVKSNVTGKFGYRKVKA